MDGPSGSPTNNSSLAIVSSQANGRYDGGPFVGVRHHRLHLLDVSYNNIPGRVSLKNKSPTRVSHTSTHQLTCHRIHPLRLQRGMFVVIDRIQRKKVLISI
jgi:hypothetical protein